MPGARRHLALLGVTVAHDQAFARLVDYVGVGVQVGLALDQQRRSEHLLGGQTAQLVQADAVWVLLPRLRACLVLASTLAYSSPPVSPGRLVGWFNLEGTSLP